MLCSRPIVSKEMVSTYYYDMRVTNCGLGVCVCVDDIGVFDRVIGLEAL